MRIKSVFKHSGQAVLEGALVSLLVVGLMAGTAFAAKGGGGKPVADSGTMVLGIVDDVSADGLVNWADTITFTVTTSADRPFVGVNCYQGSAWVYSASVGFFPDYPWSQNFILNATSWSGGAADCTVKLYTTKDGIRITTLATSAFHANG